MAMSESAILLEGTKGAGSKSKNAAKTRAFYPPVVLRSLLNLEQRIFQSFLSAVLSYVCCELTLRLSSISLQLERQRVLLWWPLRQTHCCTARSGPL